ncbi:DUF4383 domain-containing protein [Pseudonocardia sp.]|jgi:hypothetical protein|uniref:DUF4383 domain-containing protein n=1 Tax=Pseudonocardia sp. TaxID=60912 RepID=UPI0031FBA815
MNEVGRGSRAGLDAVHRVGAVLFGLGLWVFGIFGIVGRVEPFSTSGEPVLGLSSNGLLSVISLIVGGVLIAAAVRGGRMASTVTVAVGAAFVLSGLANVLVLDTPLNLLAFRMSNVIFSLVSGALLLFLGAYGRFTGGLPADNPYQVERHGGGGQDVPLPTVFRDHADVIAARELAEAERAVAQHAATPEQVARVAVAGGARRAEDRVSAWRAGRG